MEIQMTSSMTRRTALVGAAALAAFSSSAQADIVKFDQSAFEAAQAAGKSILVEITAPWCPVCKVQKPLIASLKDKPAYKGVMVFQIDFDSQKAVLPKLSASSQSTIIAFKGKEEKKRSVGQTDAQIIEDHFKASI
jgi:thioredoxin 1